MSNINKYTTKEVLNKVLLDSSGDAVNAYSHTSQEALNTALDATNNRLNVSLKGGTISGDVTINGDLTVNGDGSGNYDEIVDGNLVLTSGSKLGIGMGDATVSYPLHVQDQVDGNYIAYFKNTDADNGYGVAIDAGDDANVNALQVRTVGGSNLFVVNGAGNATVGSSSIADSTLNIESSSSGDPKLKFTATSNRSSVIDFVEGSTLQGAIVYKHNGDTLGFSTGSTNRTERFVVNETSSYFTSKLGIGTDSPSSLFHVTSSTADGHIIAESTHAGSNGVVDIRSVADRDSVIHFREGTTVKARIKNDASADALVLTDGADSNTVFIKSNKMGIGTDSPQASLHV